MKVTVAKYLNVRVGKPSLNAPCYQYLAPGSVIEVEDELYDGEEEDGTYEGINKWFKDAADNYYWSGGFEKVLASDSTKKKSTKVQNDKDNIFDFGYYYDETNDALLHDISLNELLNIDSDIKLNQGESVSIAILDHPFPNIEQIFQNRKVDLIDGGQVQEYHGLQMASLIGAFDINGSNKYTSFSPKCKLVSVPISINGDKNNQYIINGIDKIFENYLPFEIIVNVSFSIDNNEDRSKLKTHFERLAENYLVVAAAGENELLLSNSKLQWPASLDNVLAVGTVSDSFLEEFRTPTFNEKLDILLPAFKYPSFNFDPPPRYKSVKGDSSATAIVSSIAAMLVRKNGTLKRDRFLELIYRESIAYSEVSSLYSIKPINPKS